VVLAEITTPTANSSPPTSMGGVRGGGGASEGGPELCLRGGFGVRQILRGDARASKKRAAGGKATARLALIVGFYF
jgi:hypothetical protein